VPTSTIQKGKDKRTARAERARASGKKEDGVWVRCDYWRTGAVEQE